MPCPLGYKYNCEMVYSKVKLPTKLGIYQKLKWSSPNNGIYECKLLKHERDDLNTLNIVSKQLRKCQNSSIKAYKGMKHAMMRNRECTLKNYTLNEGVYKNVLPPFPITKFLRLASSTICDIWDLAFL